MVPYARPSTSLSTTTTGPKPLVAMQPLPVVSTILLAFMLLGPRVLLALATVLDVIVAHVHARIAAVAVAGRLQRLDLGKMVVGTEAKVCVCV
jgi:hypothetical protein